ncbi:hypothetical protein [Kordia sp.]|uniref:hypothetical protein n=1 Tax=Kordia sp. TaxID=1965332 RepID=UPI003B5B524F
MKYIYLFFIGCLISCDTKIKPLDSCNVDFGIKTEKLYIGDEFLEEVSEYHELKEFDRKGNILKVFKTEEKKTVNYIYKANKLQYMITSVPNSHNKVQLEEEIEYTIDTVFITKRDDRGRVLEAIHTRDKKIKYEFVACEKESYEMFISGKKTVFSEVFKKEGVPILGNTVIYGNDDEEEISYSINFKNYQYDDNGHWIKRTLVLDNKESYTEFRILTYY